MELTTRCLLYRSNSKQKHLLRILAVRSEQLTSVATVLSDKETCYDYDFYSHINCFLVVIQNVTIILEAILYIPVFDDNDRQMLFRFIDKLYKVSDNTFSPHFKLGEIVIDLLLSIKRLFLLNSSKLIFPDEFKRRVVLCLETLIHTLANVSFAIWIHGKFYDLESIQHNLQLEEQKRKILSCWVDKPCLNDIHRSKTLATREYNRWEQLYYILEVKIHTRRKLRIPCPTITECRDIINEHNSMFLYYRIINSEGHIVEGKEKSRKLGVIINEKLWEKYTPYLEMLEFSREHKLDEGCNHCSHKQSIHA
jgi:hypothetical protein